MTPCVLNRTDGDGVEKSDDRWCWCLSVCKQRKCHMQNYNDWSFCFYHYLCPIFVSTAFHLVHTTYDILAYIFLLSDVLDF